MVIDDACRVCAGNTRFLFMLEVLGRPVRYLECPGCSYVQTEKPTWLAQAYAQVIGDADTGIMLRNRANVNHVLTALAATGRPGGRVVDLGGGYGILVRMLRDCGVDAWWRDKHCENLFARGFEAPDGRYDLATAFEVFEHFEHPLDELRAMLEASPAVLLSTTFAPAGSALRPDWWYLVPEYGQHIGFLRPATVAWMAASLGCSHATDGVSVHLFAHDPAVTRRWAWLRRVPWIAPRLAALRLRSRTNEDFEAARARTRRCGQQAATNAEPGDRS